MSLITPGLKAELDKNVGKHISELNRDGGLFREMSKQMIEYLMNREISDQLGYEKHQENPQKNGNGRNGHNRKSVKSTFGKFDLDTPRDRHSEYAPQIVKKHQNDISMFDEQIISMYSKGMSVRDIQSHVQSIWGIEMSPATISNVTNRVIEHANEWQQRLLESVYAIVYFDAVHYKVRSDGAIESRAAYTCLGVDCDGKKDILGIWIGDVESAKFWLAICNELQARGVQDILIACLDGLKGLPEAIQTAFPKTEIQLCVVHMIRNSLKYIPSKHEKQFIIDLKAVYKSPSETLGRQALDALLDRWQKSYPNAVNPWLNHWDKITCFFKFPAELRRLIYTTNSVEAVHRQFRKITKSKAVFPNDQALFKILFLVASDIVKKWDKPVFAWRTIFPHLAIFFDGRLPID